MDANKIVLPFIGVNDNPHFVRGFEVGQIWMLMKSYTKFDNYLFHWENKEQIELMCKRFQYKFKANKVDGIWGCLFAEIGHNIN